MCVYVHVYEHMCVELLNTWSLILSFTVNFMG